MSISALVHPLYKQITVICLIKVEVWLASPPTPSFNQNPNLIYEFERLPVYDLYSTVTLYISLFLSLSLSHTHTHTHTHIHTHTHTHSATTITDQVLGRTHMTYLCYIFPLTKSMKLNLRKHQAVLGPIKKLCFLKQHSYK